MRNLILASPKQNPSFLKKLSPIDSNINNLRLYIEKDDKTTLSIIAKNEIY